MKSIIKSLVSKGITINVENMTIESLFHTGGTKTDQECIEYLKKYIGIGFCQPKFYKASIWNEAKFLMLQLEKQKLVYSFDYGKGKGKFSTDLGFNEIFAYLGITK